MTMIDFFIEYEAMIQEVEEEKQAHEQMQEKINQMRFRNGK